MVVKHVQAGAAGVRVGGTPSRLQQVGPTQPIPTARPQRWVLGQEEQHHPLTLALNVAKLGTGRETVQVCPLTILYRDWLCPWSTATHVCTIYKSLARFEGVTLWFHA